MKFFNSLKNKKLKFISNNYYSYPLLLKELLHAKDLYNRKLNILDFGCGKGKLLQVLEESKIKCNLYGVDIFKSEEDFLEIKKDNYFADIKSITPYQNFDFGVKFNVIISNMVFEHIENLSLVYEHLRKILKEDGIIIAGFPTKEVIIEPHLKLPFIHLIKKDSVFLMNYLKFALLLNIGEFKSLKGKSNYVKNKYLNNRFQYCNKNLFYLDYKEHQDLIRIYYSKVIEISDITLNYLRNYQTPSNIVKLMISILPFRKLRIILFRFIFGTYIIIFK